MERNGKTAYRSQKPGSRQNDDTSKPARPYQKPGEKKYAGGSGEGKREYNSQKTNRRQGDESGKPARPYQKPGEKKYAGGSGEGKRGYDSQRASGKPSRSDDRYKPSRPRQKPPERQYEPVTEDNSGMMLIGRNAVLESLNHEKPIDRIYIKSGGIEGTLKVIFAKAKEQGIVIKEISRDRLDEMAGKNANHQGVIASCPFVPYSSLEDIFEKAEKVGEPPFIIVLDEIKDPHNLGAIIRTAEAAGAHGIIIPARRAVGLTAAVGKTSAGAVAHVLVAKVTNLVPVIEELKKKGVWTACADMTGESVYKADLKGGIALIIGGEGDGVSRLVKEKCDFCISLPMQGVINSLNASVAAGVLMYEVVRARSLQ